MMLCAMAKGQEVRGKNESVEYFHCRSKNQILELNGEYITRDNLERIERGVDSINVVEYSPYKKNIGSFYCHGGECRIEVCNIDPEQLERTTQHETNHFMSFYKEKCELANCETLDRRYHRMSGIHQSEYIVDIHDEMREIKDANRGFNEGITQMYTNRQLEMIEPYKGELSARQNGYQMATELTEQLEDIVGKEAIAKAYYGGELKELVKKIDSLGGDGSFERLSKDIDKVTYSEDMTSRVIAMRDAQDLLAKMSEV